MQQDITDSILAGQTDLAAIAAGLDLDIVDGAIVEEGWIAYDGDAEVEYEYATSGREAAEEYVADGDWNERDATIWIEVRTWRRGWRRVECASCREAAIGHDADGDPACAEHAAATEEGAELADLVEEVRVDEETHTVALEPVEPDCEQGRAHDWRSPHSVVGGCAQSPGVQGHGGGVIVREVCRHCGTYQITDTWAQDMSTGRQGLTSLAYEPADEVSSEWVAARAAREEAQ